jgi:(p)ppGpp synthase/HD superfamily hydrolase
MALPADIADSVGPSRLVQEAYEMASRAHDGQSQKVSGRPLIEHPLAVARVVAEAGFDQEVVTAALLHDVLEETAATLDELRERFGERVADLVEAMTDEAEISPYERRKALHRERVAAAGADAGGIYAADKLCGMRALRIGYTSEGDAVARRYKVPLDVKLRVWEADREMLSRYAGQIPYLDALDEELEALLAEVSPPP